MTKKNTHIAMLTALLLCLSQLVMAQRIDVEPGKDGIERYALDVSDKLEKGLTIEAFREAKEMEAMTRDSGSDYEKYITKLALGKVYYHRRDYRNAVKVFGEAIGHISGARQERQGLKVYETHMMMGEALFHLHEKNAAYKSFADALLESADIKDSLVTFLSQAQMLVEYGDVVTFRSIYRQIGPQSQNIKDMQKLDVLNMLRAYRYMYDNDFSAALDVSCDIIDAEKALRLQRDIYNRQSDYFSALDAENRLIALKDSIFLNLTNQDIMLLNEQYDNNALRAHAEQQAAELLQMQIMQQQQRQQQADMRSNANDLKAAKDIERARQDSLNAVAELTRSRMARAQTESKRAEIISQTRQTNYANTIMCLVIYMLTCIGISGVLVLKRSHSTAHKLSVLAEQLEQAHTDATNTNKIKTAFIQNMNYEVRAPLNEVMGFAQLLGANDIALSEEERIEYGQHITDSAMAINALVGSILAIADIESGKRELSLQEHKAADIIAAAVRKSKEFSPPGVVITGEPCGDISIVTDGRRAQQVLTYLVKHSFKHMPSGTITLSCTERYDGRAVVFTMTDTSGPTSHDMEEGIVTTLRDTQNANTAPFMNLGICKMVADKLGATIDYDPSYTQGVRFVFTLPKDTKTA